MLSHLVVDLLALASPPGSTGLGQTGPSCTMKHRYISSTSEVPDIDKISIASEYDMHPQTEYNYICNKYNSHV